MAIALDANLGTQAGGASLTTTSAAAAASRVIMFLWWFEPAGTCTGCGGGGLTWVVDIQYETAADDHHCAIVSADAPSGLASSTVITPTFSSAVDFGPSISAASFTGLATGASGYVDTTAAGKDDTNQAWATNNFVTTNADDLLTAVSLGVADGGSNTPGASASEIHDFAGIDGKMCTEYRIVSSASTYTLAGTWASAVAVQQNVGVAYKSGTAAAANVNARSFSPIPFMR